MSSTSEVRRLPRTTGERRPAGRAPQRSGGAAFGKSDPGPAMPSMAEQEELERRIKIRSRIATQKVAAELAQVRVTIPSYYHMTHTASSSVGIDFDTISNKKTIDAFWYLII